MTQWYPKIAAYDEHGWHPDPYVAREFYGEYGTYDVKISMDYNYKLGGTGTLLNEKNIWKTVREEKDIQYMDLLPSREEKRQWHFYAENVHDFAWAADPGFIRTS